jgi:flagellin-like protein
MKANRSVRGADEAVSPVIAVILMVAITVVLAATVYLWVSGFSGNQQGLIDASYSAKAVDMPSLGGLGNVTGDTDTSPDAMQISYSSGQSNFTWSDITITVDGTTMGANNSAVNPLNAFKDNTSLASPGATQSTYCTSLPGSRAMTTAGAGVWERGESVYLWKANGNCNAWALSPALQGPHSIQVSVRGQIVLDTNIEILDDGKT